MRSFFSIPKCFQSEKQKVWKSNRSNKKMPSKCHKIANWNKTGNALIGTRRNKSVRRQRFVKSCRLKMLNAPDWYIARQLQPAKRFHELFVWTLEHSLFRLKLQTVTNSLPTPSTKRYLCKHQERSLFVFSKRKVKFCCEEKNFYSLFEKQKLYQTLSL